MGRAGPVLVLIVSLGIAALGVAVGSMGIVGSLFSQEAESLAIATMSVSLVALTVGLGLGLAWQAWQAIQGRPSKLFAPRHVWIWAMLFAVLLGAGHFVLTSEGVPRALFPFFHVAAGALPPLVLVSAVGRGLGPVTRNRDVVLEVGSGAFVSTLIAVTIEIVLLAVLVGIVLAALALQGDGLALIQELLDGFIAGEWATGPESLAPLTRSPIVAGAIVLAVSLIVPLVEEAVKTVGVGLRIYRTPTQSEALLWGVACGAGFALIEGLLNTIVGLDAWAAVVLLRVGATLLHCFTGALMGLAWYSLVRQRQVGRALKLFFTSVAVHGLWNLLSISISLGSWAPLEDQTNGALPFAFGLDGLLASLLVVLTLAVALALVTLVRYARFHWVEPSGLSGELTASASDT